MNRKSFHLSIRNKGIFLSLFLILLLAYSCEKEPVPLTTNSVIKGRVYGVYPETDEGFLVTAYGPYGNSSAYTDVNGYFQIKGIGNGTYYVEYSKEGYGTIRQYNIQVFGNDTVTAYVVQMYKLPSSLKLPYLRKCYTDVRPRYYPEKQWICFDTDVTLHYADKFGMDFMLCMDTSDDVSWDRYKLVDFTWSGQYNGDSWSFYIDPEIIRYQNSGNFPFKSGEKVYVRGYPCNKGEASGYLDTYLGKRQFSTLDKTRSTNVVSFIMP